MIIALGESIVAVGVGAAGLVVAAACLALIPVGTAAPALLTLVVLAFLTSALIAFEAIKFREARARIRASQLSAGWP